MVGPEECDVYVSCDPGSDKWGHELKDALADIGLTAFVARLPKWDSSLEWTLQHARAVVFCTKPGELAPRMLDELSRAGRGALVIPVAAGPLPGALDPWLPFAWSLDSAKPQAFALQLALMVAPTGRSASVGSVLKDLHGPVPASAIIRELFKIHPEYGGKRGREVRLGEEPSERVLPAETWLVSVRALFTSSSRFTRSTGASGPAASVSTTIRPTACFPPRPGLSRCARCSRARSPRCTDAR